ncbi:MAG: TIGR03546 family protein [Treponema sp.]|nr:TIGR03546 family protein [Treponema sp.]
MLKAIINFFKALNSNAHPSEIAHSFALGMILGFMPKNNALWYILTVLFFFLRINRGALIIMTLIFSMLAPLLDPLFDTIGYAFLNIEFFEPVFRQMLEIPFVGFTKFNNTIVSGSLLFALFMYVPVFMLSKVSVKGWRAKLAPALRKTKIIKVISKLPLVKKIGESL